MDIFTLFGTIAINNDEANRSIDETKSKTSGLASSMKSSFDNMGKVATNLGKTLASGLAIGAAAVGTIVGSAISEYAEYEQLVGGVETLFKDSSDKVLGYAQEAYKNQGLSANDYLEQVTSFSASLISGLNGDTAAAAEMANIAITDMSDNANTFGTDISMIQNAYQGFAKDNYTMLDNLKLGYGGTAEEMARLIDDSGVLGSAMTVTADNVNDLSFDVYIAAIHEIQTQMGITGRTAEEASSTISGSWGALKGAWSNLLVGLAKDEEMQPLADALLETGNTFVGNITDKLPIIKENFIEAFTYIAENGGEIMSALKTAINDTFNIDTKTVWFIELIAGTAAMLSGHYGLGLSLFAAAGITEDYVWDEAAEQYKLASGLLDGDPAAIEAHNSSVATDDGTEVQYFAPDEWEEELRQRYEDTGKTTTEDTTVQPPVEWSAPFVEKIIDSFGPGEYLKELLERFKEAGKPVPEKDDTQTTWGVDGVKEITDFFGTPSGTNELQTTIQNWTNTFDMDAFASKISDAVVSGMGNVTITTGDVRLNDGTLVGRILPQINLELGQLILQKARG